MDSGRRSHRKSRKGCVQCKKRKIKCDENRPSCQNCVRHKTQCLFVETPSASSVQSQSPAASTPLQSGAFSTYGSEDTALAHGSQSGNSLAHFSMVEMELLHNFSTYTCYSLDRNPHVQTVWRINVPQVAFSYNYVMHAVLALSALHLSYSRPSMKSHYVDLALRLHERGLAEVTNILPAVNESNCTAVYIFSALTGIISFAKPRKPGDFLLTSSDGTAEWLILFRGSKHIIETYRDILISGDLRSMFHFGIRRLQLWEKNGGDHHEALTQLNHSLEICVSDQKFLEIFKSATAGLARSFYLLQNTQVQSTDSADVFIWLFHVSDDYLNLLYSRNQEAMAIFAFFCVLLKELEWSWYTKGWSVHLISAIYRSLDAEHRTWIQWPIERVQWIPN